MKNLNGAMTYLVHVSRLFRQLPDASKKWCIVTSIPQRVCKVITIHKSQGMSVGPGNPFESAVIYLPDDKGQRSNSESELVATSRVTDISFSAIYDTNRQVIMEPLEKLEVVIVITKKTIR